MNWGNKLLVTFIVFGVGMLYLVYRAVNTNYELVEKDYYNQELRYQQIIDGTNRANLLNSPVKIEQTDSAISIALPHEMKNKEITGNILFYCAYDQKKDKKISLQPNADGLQVFDLKEFSPGNYTVKINWTSEGKNYFSEKTLTVL